MKARFLIEKQYNMPETTWKELQRRKYALSGGPEYKNFLTKRVWSYNQEVAVIHAVDNARGVDARNDIIPGVIMYEEKLYVATFRTLYGWLRRGFNDKTAAVEWYNRITEAFNGDYR